MPRYEIEVFEVRVVKYHLNAKDAGDAVRAYVIDDCRRTFDLAGLGEIIARADDRYFAMLHNVMDEPSTEEAESLRKAAAKLGNRFPGVRTVRRVSTEKKERKRGRVRSGD